MNSVTTKVAVEIPMHFEESDGNAAARKEKGKHGAGGSTPTIQQEVVCASRT